MLTVPFGDVLVCHAGREPHPAAIELESSADIRVRDVLEALLAELAGQLRDRHHLRAGALADVDQSP